MTPITKVQKFLFSVLFFITPLIVIPWTSELFEYNKVIFIYLVTTMAGFFWLVDFVFYKKNKNIRNKVTITLLIFLLSQILSTIFSIDHQTSLFGYYGRFNGGLTSIICYILLFLIFISTFEKKFIFSLLKLSLLSSFLVILWAIPGKFGYDLSCLVFAGQLNNSCWTDQFHPELRMFSTLGQPNWLGAYLVINFFMCLYFFVKNQKKHKSLLLTTGYLLICFTSILFTRSRSAYLALIIGMTIFIVFNFYLNKIVNKEAKILYIKKLGLILLIFLFLILIFKTGIDKVDKWISVKTYLSKEQGNKVTLEPKNTQKLNITESFDIRKIVWLGAIRLGLKYPLFGTGVETFAYSYYFTRPLEHNLTSEWDFLYNKAHNEYLNYFATTGFFGMISYLLMICLVFYLFISKIKTSSFVPPSGTSEDKQNSKVKENNNLAIWQFNNDRLLTICLFLAYLSILITNFFGFSTTTISLFFFLIPAFIVVLNKKEEGELPIKKSLSLKSELLLFLGVLITIYLLFSIACYYLADIYYTQAENYYRADDFQKASEYVNRALKLRSEHVYQDRLSFYLANLALITSYQKEKETSKKLIEISQYYNNQSLKASPANVLYWKARAKNDYFFYEATSTSKYLEDGIESLKKGLLFSPYDPKIYYSLAAYYSLLDDEVTDKNEKTELRINAIQAVDKAIKLKPDFEEGKTLKEQLYKKYKLK